MKNPISIATIFLILSFYLTAFVGCKKADSADFNYKEKFVIQLDSGRISTSACIVDGYLYVLSTDNKHYQKINLGSGEMTQEKFPIDFQKTTTISHSGNKIIVSDISDRSLTFFDHDFQFKKRIVLNRFPLDFRVYNNKCIFMTDILQQEIYNYVLVEENLLSHKEEIVFSGDTLNIFDLRKVLNLDTPGTICYDYDGKYIYAARQRYDSYVIHRFRPGKFSLTDDFINNREWQPVKYNESEYLETKHIYSDILAISNYPLEKLTFSHKLAILAITVDERGRLWVVSSNSDDLLSLDIYSDDGEKIRNIVLNGAYKAKLLVSDNYFVLLETDNSHPRIFVYGITEK